MKPVGFALLAGDSSVDSGFMIMIMIHLYSAFTINIQWRCLQLKLVKVKKIKLYLKLYYNKIILQ